MTIKKDHLFVRTFERGVENLTLACGTGVVASAIVAAEKSENQFDNYFIKTDGGDLKVKLKKKHNNYSDIWLEGPVVKVFEGIYER
jgi:diaminopimelate epimerase